VPRGSIAPISPYHPDAGIFDEALEADGSPRPAYGDLLAVLERTDLGALAAALAEDVAASGVSFRADDSQGDSFCLDAVPRLLEAETWTALARGLTQRVRALDRFVADAYGERAIVAAGVVPARALDSCDHLEPTLGGLPAPAVRIAVAGLDVVRDAQGDFRVLEDNVRTPSGLAYALAAREALGRRFPEGAPGPAEPVTRAVEMLGRALAAAAPDGVDEPSIVLLSDGPANSAFYEHRRLARELGVPGVTLEDLSVRSGRLHARCDATIRPVDVVYRRTNEDRLTDESGELTAVGAALHEPLRTGKLAVMNGFGTGVADDKLIHAYVEDIVRFYLGEEPLLRSVRTYDLGAPEMLEMALDRIDELVIKPRTGHGGRGVVVAPHAHTTDIRRTADEVSADPTNYIAQELVMLSRHPTVVDSHLEPRHVDLRPFVFLSPAGAEVAPGGLTRVALERAALVVNSSQRGGIKDTWVLR
jgi:uncharacterized circularly permuted ATP-grasp superfamily protein